MRKPFVLIALLALAVPGLAAQGEEPKTDEALVAKAVKAIDDALAVTESLRLADNRLRVQMTAADSLWAHDPERARRALAAAGATIAEAVLDLNFDDPAHSDRFDTLMSARTELISQFANRDPLAALEFMTTTRAALPADRAARLAEQERTLEMSIARMLAAKDPARAAEIVKASLEKGLSYDALSLLRYLRDSDHADAAAIAELAVEKARSARLLEDYQVMMGVGELLRMEMESRAASEEQRAKALLSDKTLRGLLDTIVSGLRAAASSEYFVYQQPYVVQFASMLSGPTMDGLARFSPSHAAALEKQFSSLPGGASASRQPHTIEMPGDDASIDKVLQQADAAPPGMRETIYYQIAHRLAAQGDLGRARQIISERVSDPSHRASYLESIDRFALHKVINEERFAEAIAAADSLQSLSDRVSTLVQISKAAKEKGEEKSAAAALERADAILGERARDQMEFYSKLVLAEAYLEVDSPRAFAILENCVDQLNRLADAAAIIDGFGCGDIFDRGEMRITHGGTVGGLFVQTIGMLSRFGETDFDRARAVADRIERHEARAQALVNIAAGVLAKTAEAKETRP